MAESLTIQTRGYGEHTPRTPTLSSALPTGENDTGSWVMVRLGRYELWQISGVLALAALFVMALAIGFGWGAGGIGACAGMTIAWAAVALGGFLVTQPVAPGSQPLVHTGTRSSGAEHDRGVLEDPRELVESIGDPVIVIAPSGEVVLANERASRILGLSRPLVGRFVEEVITKAELLDRISAGRRGDSWRGPVRLPGREGMTVCDVSVAPITDESPAAVVLTLRDITQLDGALKLKTDFVANASHELRTPIAAIKGAAETLSIAKDDEKMRTKLIKMIEGHVGRLESMVSDLLDLSKLESETMTIDRKPVAIDSLAAEITQLMQGLCDSRSVRIEFDIEPGAQNLVTDRALLSLILRNLVENGAKFTAEGTACRVGVSAEGEAWVIRVRDEGPGIPLAQQQRIFERFYQVDAARTGPQRGTGLGLAIVKHAVRLLGGEVTVESVWQQGTTMVVRLPKGGSQSQSAPSSL